jgi:serine/threonine-protein kinase
MSAGLVLANRYRLLTQLGSGGMGTVWRAEHVNLRSLVAVKLLSEAQPLDGESATRFMREARAAATLRSPHIVQVLDYGVDEGRPFIAMELLDGEPLADVMERLGRLTPVDTAVIITQVCRAVARAHEASFVHRDLKPENLFVVRNDDEALIKVLDFGVAKAVVRHTAEATGVTRHGTVLGTPYYMSPEQLECLPTVDYRTDLWALAVITFECLLGRLPFEGRSLPEIFRAVSAAAPPLPSALGEVPPGFDAWFEKGTARDPAQRFASAKDLAASLREVCQVGDNALRLRATLLRDTDSAGATQHPLHDANNATERAFVPGGYPAGVPSSAPKGEGVQRVAERVSAPDGQLDTVGGAQTLASPQHGARAARTSRRPAALVAAGAIALVALGWAFAPARSARVSAASTPIPGNETPPQASAARVLNAHFASASPNASAASSAGPAPSEARTPSAAPPTTSTASAAQRRAPAMPSRTEPKKMIPEASRLRKKWEEVGF